MKVKLAKEVYLTMYAAICIVFNSAKLVHLYSLTPRLSVISRVTLRHRYTCTKPTAMATTLLSWSGVHTPTRGRLGL